MGIIGLAPDATAGRWRVLKGFLLTAAISVVVFGLCIGVFALGGWLGIDNDVVGAVFYITTFYAAPLGFVVGVIGSIIAAIRYAVARQA
jgi:hypothetical protein